MAEILIRKVDDDVKRKLQRRAARRGKSLEADLRDALAKLAEADSDSPDDTLPFGDWLVAITRPGVDLDGPVRAMRAGRVRKLPDFK
jgi:plasmid stability protein